MSKSENMDISIVEDNPELESDYLGIPDPNNQPTFDPTKIDVITQNRTIDALLSRLKHGEMDLSPDFQRSANLWNAERKTSLIESILLRIPIPSLYVSEDEKGNYAVVDGLQRMSAIAHFVDVDSLNDAVAGELRPLKLEKKGLRSFQELAGLTFTELERPLQRRIRETELTIHVIRSGTPSQVKFNIFSRINQGGIPLNAQEIRNTIYPGEWRKRIRDIAESAEFSKATEGKIPTARMQDLELVLRAVALSQQHTPRPNDQNLEDYLNNFVESQCQGWDEKKWADVQAHIKAALKVAPIIFGEYAFRKFYAPTSKKKPINVGLFEAQVGLLAQYSGADLLLLTNYNEVVKSLFVLASDSSEYMNQLRTSDELLFFQKFHEFLDGGDDDERKANSNLSEGTTTATSKGLASNQRVSSIKYIFTKALEEKGHGIYIYQSFKSHGVTTNA